MTIWICVNIIASTNQNRWPRFSSRQRGDVRLPLDAQLLTPSRHIYASKIVKCIIEYAANWSNTFLLSIFIRAWRWSQCWLTQCMHLLSTALEYIARSFRRACPSVSVIALASCITYCRDTVLETRCSMARRVPMRWKRSVNVRHVTAQLFWQPLLISSLQNTAQTCLVCMLL